MKLDFARNAKRAAIAAIVNKIVGLVLPFVNRTLFLWLLAPEYLGLNGLFTSVLGVLSLADLGFGTAVVCSMYKPVARDDIALTCAYLKFYRTVYRIVGAVVFAGGLCLLPFIGGLVHGTIPAGMDLRILFLIHLANTSASYFLFAYRGAVLNAYHRGDVQTNIRTATTIAQYATVFLILVLTRNYYAYVAATVVFTVAHNIMTVLAARRLFPAIEPKGTLPPDLKRRVISDVKSIFMHRLGAVVTNQADNIVISAFLGLSAVAAYGNYWYVYTAVGGLAWSFYSSMQNGFGNTIFTETKEQNFVRFMKANKCVMAVVAWCAAMMAAMYEPFIAIWTRTRPELARHLLTPMLMVLYFYVYQSRQTLLVFKAAASIWREDRWKPVVAGAVNLAANIIFVMFLPDAYKLDGVILSSIVSFMFIQTPWESHVLFKSFFGRGASRIYWRAQAFHAACTAISCAGTWAAAHAVPLGGLAGFAAKGMASAAAATAFVVVFFRVKPGFLRGGVESR